ncbi:hypothetical protein QTP88_010955 [Uroleucon formosanum]
MVFGREIKAPGDWQLELAEESPDDGNNAPDLSGAYQNPSVKTEDSLVKPDDAPVMAERANHPPPTRNNRPFRGMIATHVEKLRAMVAQLLREARRLSGDGPEDTVGGWSAERAATASFGRIRASPTAWALFERGFTEGRRSTRANTPQPEIARHRAGPPG